jgi:hypothetical protein
MYEAGSFGSSIAVDCSATWNGSASVSPAGGTATVPFDPALSDHAYRVIELDCGAQICVRCLAGDINWDGVVVKSRDASVVKPHFGDMPKEATARFDFDVSGVVRTGDFSQVKPKFRNTLVNPCP